MPIVIDYITNPYYVVGDIVALSIYSNSEHLETKVKYYLTPVIVI